MSKQSYKLREKKELMEKKIKDVLMAALGVVLLAAVMGLCEAGDTDTYQLEASHPYYDKYLTARL